MSVLNLDLSTNFTDHIVNGINTLLPRLPNALFDLLLGILIIRLLVRVVKYTLKLTHVQDGFRQVLTSVLEMLMWVLLSITLLNELGFSGVIYFFSGSVFAIGLLLSAGGSTLASDVVAGIFLARDRDFNVGDEVIAGETPTMGIVEHIDARRVRLRDSNGVLHVIPNSLIERKEWVVVRRRNEVSALVKAAKTAQRLTAAAREKSAAVTRKSRRVRDNDQ
ncbi:MAG TPA: mechanosensitive ion channel domain-containing protein [Candidatus Saccharimonadia bacterium]|jgi:small-conductance mechanosensitive channel